MAPGPRYGDSLLPEAAKHFGSALQIDAQARNGTPISIGPMVANGTYVSLSDAIGATISRLTVQPGAVASRAASWLARRTDLADNLAEPDPFVSGAGRTPSAHLLVEHMLDRCFPDLATLALHVAPLGQDNVIIASSFGRIGKPGDKDDARVERDGAILREVTNNGRRLAVELPLLDRNGRAIGALSTSFAVTGSDPQAAHLRAVAVRTLTRRRQLRVSLSR